MKNKNSFNKKCYNVLKKVPRGKVTTYREIAHKLNSKAYRAVGNAMHKNPFPGCKKGQTPCCRVIKSNGEVGGFARGTKKKISLLQNECIEVISGKINLSKYIFKFQK